VKLHKIKQPR